MVTIKQNVEVQVQENEEKAKLIAENDKLSQEKRRSCQQRDATLKMFNAYKVEKKSQIEKEK